MKCKKSNYIYTGMSCSKISECLVAFMPLNYQSPANFESVGDYCYFAG